MARSNIQMAAQKREGSGKGTARALRRAEKIPAVIYGDNQAPVTISLDKKPLTMEYHKGHLYTSLCDMDVEGDKHLVIARDVQLHPVTDDVLHADFLRVTKKTVLNVDVPVHFEGQDDCVGLKHGGSLSVSNYEVSLTCPATAIPDNITINIAAFDIGHMFRLSDVMLPEGVKPATDDPESVLIATINAPRKAVEPKPAEEGEAAEGEAAAEGDAAEGGDAPAEEKKD